MDKVTACDNCKRTFEPFEVDGGVTAYGFFDI